MQVTTFYAGAALSVYGYRCTRGPGDRPLPEVHARHSLSYVRRGSFGCRTLGREHDLIAGALMVGRPGREYTATHEYHASGDECLSVKMSPEFAESLCRPGVWDLARVPPLPELMVLGELTQAAAEGRASVGVDEAALLLAAKVAAVVAPGSKAVAKVSASERRRAVETALWLEAKMTEPVGLEDAARHAGASPFHFLRTFRNALGVTPHQYLVRKRLARAAKLLAEERTPITEVSLEVGFADLSNFVRTFRRAAGVSPRAFRKAAKGERKILQERLGLAA